MTVGEGGLMEKLGRPLSRGVDFLLARLEATRRRTRVIGCLVLVAFLVSAFALLWAGRGFIAGTVLSVKVAEGDTEGVRRLLDAGVDPNGAGVDITPLEMAIDSGHLEIARLLLDRGANPELGSTHQRTPLQRAALSANPAMVHLLLARGANPNRPLVALGTESLPGGGRREKSRTYHLLPSLMVRWCGRELDEAVEAEIVELLLQSGADPNAEGLFGGTALQTAEAAGKTRVAEVLREYGADEEEER